MCGLYFEINQVEKKNEYYNKKIHQLSHRGPENYSIKKINLDDFNLIFCNTLLNTVGSYKDSIQPIDTENYTIICNGTIYNFAELSKNNKNSDIFTLAEGLYSEGIDFIQKCEGTFAFIFLNKKKKK